MSSSGKCLFRASAHFLIGFVFLMLAYITFLYILGLKVKVPQSCVTLCEPMDYAARGILQARTLEWVAIPFSSGPCFVRTLYHDPSVFGGLTWHGNSASKESSCNAGVQFSSVQWLSHVWLFVTPWTAASQASLSFTISWSLLKLMSIESVMPFNHLILCHPLLRDIAEHLTGQNNSLPQQGSIWLKFSIMLRLRNLGLDDLSQTTLWKICKL